MAHRPNRAKQFVQHLNPLQGVLEGYCRRNLVDPNAVEDALQSAVANAYRDFHLYLENTNFRSWIFRYLHLEILGRNRQFLRNRHGVLPDEFACEQIWEAIAEERLWDVLLEAPEEALQYCDDVVGDAVRSLPPLERSALLLRAIGEFKYREIAEILEIPVGSVMGYLGRARTALRCRLADYHRQCRPFRKAE